GEDFEVDELLLAGALVESAQDGHFHAAGSAPACPESDDDVAASIVDEGDRMAVESGKAEARCGFVERKLVRGMGVRGSDLEGLGAPGDPHRKERENGYAEARHVNVIIRDFRFALPDYDSIFRAHLLLQTRAKVSTTSWTRYSGGGIRNSGCHRKPAGRAQGG